jgi:hypothetical protein
MLILLICQGKRRLISVVQSIADRGRRKEWGIPLAQVVGGIVFAVAYEIEGSLMVPITIHVLGNLAIFTLSLMSWRVAGAIPKCFAYTVTKVSLLCKAIKAYDPPIGKGSVRACNGIELPLQQITRSR